MSRKSMKKSKGGESGGAASDSYEMGLLHHIRRFWGLYAIFNGILSSFYFIVGLWLFIEIACAIWVEF